MGGDGVAAFRGEGYDVAYEEDGFVLHGAELGVEEELGDAVQEGAFGVELAEMGNRNFCRRARRVERGQEASVRGIESATARED